jgi:hypothetical protein
MNELQEKRTRVLMPVIEWLEAGASYMPSVGVDRFDMIVGIERDPDCGTTCCIAGAICQFNAPFELTKTYEWISWGDVEERARGFLEIGDKEAHELFVKKADEDLNVRPEQAAIVLRHFLKTGEVDWGVAGPIEKRTNDEE